VWWYTPVIPALRRLRQEDKRVQSQAGLHRKTLSQTNNTAPHQKKSAPIHIMECDLTIERNEALTPWLNLEPVMPHM
jgi:hypothetical protein